MRRNFNIQTFGLNAQVWTNLRSEISNLRSRSIGGGEGSRTPDPMVANHVLCQLSYTPDSRISDCGFRIADLHSEIRILHSAFERWLRGRDLNPRPLGYEPNELPDCSTPRQGQTKLPEPPNCKLSILGTPCKSEIENPKSEIRWWAWVESNYRPHAYQACALTN